MSVFLGQRRLDRASMGQQTAMPQQQPAAPVQLGYHQQQPQTVDAVLSHIHSGHPEPHPIALRHSAAHTDPYHKEEDKIVDSFMKLADMANEGKATPEHMGQMDGLKIQLAGIKQKREDEVQRLNQYMRQRVNSDADSTNPGVPQEIASEQAPPRMDTHRIGKDINDNAGQATTGSSTGFRTLPQIGKSTASGYHGGLSFQQKAVDRPLDSREKFKTKSDYAASSAAVAMPQNAGKPPAAPQRAQGGTAKPVQSVFQKGQQPFRQGPILNRADPQPVTETVASVAPGEEPETQFDRVGKGWGKQRAMAGPEVPKR